MKQLLEHPLLLEWMPFKLLSLEHCDPQLIAPDYLEHHLIALEHLLIDPDHALIVPDVPDRHDHQCFCVRLPVKNTFNMTING